MSEATGTLDVITAQGTERMTWNGDVEERLKARTAFEEMMKSGYYLAVVHEAPGKAKQVRSFDDIEKIEKERGTVTAQISTALVGG